MMRAGARYLGMHGGAQQPVADAGNSHTQPLAGHAGLWHGRPQREMREQVSSSNTIMNRIKMAGPVWRDTRISMVHPPFSNYPRLTGPPE